MPGISSLPVVSFFNAWEVSRARAEWDEFSFALLDVDLELDECWRRRRLLIRSRARLYCTLRFPAHASEPSRGRALVTAGNSRTYAPSLLPFADKADTQTEPTLVYTFR
jgi:hypothetical protein